MSAYGMRFRAVEKRIVLESVEFDQDEDRLAVRCGLGGWVPQTGNDGGEGRRR